MRYRAKVVLIVKMPDGSVVALNKYFRQGTIKKTLLKLSDYMERLERQGCSIINHFSKGRWLS